MATQTKEAGDDSAKRRFTSRKFALAVFFALVSTVAVFTGFLNGTQYISAVTLILGLYGTGDLLDKKVK